MQQGVIQNNVVLRRSGIPNEPKAGLIVDHILT